MGDRDSASLQEEMKEDPITAAIGPMDRILRRLHSFQATQHSLPEGLSAKKIRRLEEGLKGLYAYMPEAEDTSSTPKWWMKEIRELCYDTEDYLDEITNPGAGAPTPSKLKRNPEIAEDLSALLARVKSASKRSQRFNLVPNTSSQTGVSRLQLPMSAASTSVHGCSIAGVDETMNQLVKLLAFEDDNQKQLMAVPIIGFAGVGKTTLATCLYHGFRRKFHCGAFLHVSRNPDMRRLLISILSQIKAPQAHSFPDVQVLIDSVREHLQSKRYLIIIDDLWSTSAWDIISRAFPDGDCCSRIIATTQIEDVALACCNYDLTYRFEMNPLNDDLSGKLFFHRVFGSEDGCPPNFKEISYQIIRKCGGLPLATANIASMLASKMNLEMEQLKHTEDSLSSSTLRTDPTSNAMSEVVNLIYNNLSSHLKTCLLYLSMYPEGYTIRKNDLVKQWVAEGFVRAVEGQYTEETARGYFDELLSRGLIQHVDTNYNGDVLSCTVHHIVLDLIRYKSMEKNFITTVNYFDATQGILDKVRRLTVQFGGAKGAKVPKSIRMSQVRSLLFCGFFKCVPSIVDYRLLRVLTLHIWADQDKAFDLTSIHELYRLRYLKIECNITVHLPDEIRGLQYLKTLEVHATVPAIPSDICHLKNLLHLRLPSVADLPSGIDGMTSLRTLECFDLSKNSTDNVMDLGKLTKLRYLHLTCSTLELANNMEKKMECLGSILGKLRSLNCLTLVPAGSSHVNNLDDASASSMSCFSCHGLSSVSPAPTLLQRLELLPRICIFPSLPKWIGELYRLYILKIAVRELSINDIDILKGLPALTALSLYVQTASVETIIFGKRGFLVLKFFKFRCSVPRLTIEKDAMPNLHSLKLGFNAQKADQQGTTAISIEHLSSLKDISAKVWGGGADPESVLKNANNAIKNHRSNPKINMRLVKWSLYRDASTPMAIQDQEHETIEEPDEILEELPDEPCGTQDDDEREDDASTHMEIKDQEHETLEEPDEIIEEHPDIHHGTQDEDKVEDYKKQSDKLEDEKKKSDTKNPTLHNSSSCLSTSPPRGCGGTLLWHLYTCGGVRLKPSSSAVSVSSKAQNGLFWWHDLAQCNAGNFSAAVVQANYQLEDQCLLESTPLLGTVIGIFDGHGGPEAARFACDHLLPNLRKAASDMQGVTADTIWKAFQDMEEGFMSIVASQWKIRPTIAAIGTCCLVGVVQQKKLFVANLGDSRAVLGKISSSGEIVPEQLSSEHNVNFEGARQELMAQHPDDPQIVVFKHGVWRVKGIIQLSRSIGDAYLKQPQYNAAPLHAKFRLSEPFSRPILTAEPSIVIHSLQPRDRFVIFASDGLWEFLSNQEAVDIVHKHQRAGSARRLVEAALREAAKKREMRYSDLKKIDRVYRRHFHDDITVIVLFIDHLVEDHAHGKDLSIRYPSLYFGSIGSEKLH